MIIWYLFRAIYSVNLASSGAGILAINRPLPNYPTIGGGITSAEMYRDFRK